MSGKELTLAGLVYSVDGEPNFEGRYILHWPRGFEETARREKLDRARLFEKLAPIRAKLLEARHRQEQPRLDDKSITAWNGLMIEALAYAGEVLKRPEYIRMAEAAAQELLLTLRDRDGNLLHVARQGQAKLDAYLDDYAAAILGLVELSRVTDEARWRTEAAGLADAMIAKLWDPAGGFRYAPASVEHLLVQPRDAFDGACPTGNSLAASGEPRYTPYAGTLRAFAGHLEKEPRALPYMLWGLAEYRLAGLPEETAMPGAEPLLPKTSDRVRIAARLSPAVLAPGREASLEVTISMDEGGTSSPTPPPSPP